MTGGHFHSLRVAAVRRETPDAVVIGFELTPELQARFHFEPGQYLTLRHGELRRSYSICAAPGEGLRVGVRQVPGGAFSGWLHHALKPGDTIDVMEPEGRFGAALADRPRHLLAVAGGSGITPILSILKAQLARGDGARCTLVYGNRDAASTMFKEELEDLKNRHLTRLAIHPVFSREVVDSPLASGRIDADKLRSLLRLSGPVDAAFVCGPHAMNDEVEAALREAGLPAGCIHVERFGVPPEAAPVPLGHVSGDAALARVSITRDGLTREFAFDEARDPNILAAGARAGLDLPYSCRSGVCATCRARLVEGQVRMDRHFALEPKELAEGLVLCCQAHPLTARVVLSFDHR